MLLNTAAIGAAGAAYAVFGANAFGQASPAATGTFEVTHTPAEWLRLLGPERYQILREAGTEPPGSSPLDDEERRGTFSCAGCDLPLFASTTKFHSGTGWPSFYQPLRNAVKENVDRSHGMVRTEVVCHRCGGHLGHVFPDGPRPTGLRYCMNGLSLKFTPA
jgi:peptide-methionine (R)-S-oxide reductase